MTYLKIRRSKDSRENFLPRGKNNRSRHKLWSICSNSCPVNPLFNEPSRRFIVPADKSVTFLPTEIVRDILRGAAGVWEQLVVALRRIICYEIFDSVLHSFLRVHSQKPGSLPMISSLVLFTDNESNFSGSRYLDRDFYSRVPSAGWICRHRTSAFVATFYVSVDRTVRSNPLFHSFFFSP